LNVAPSAVPDRGGNPIVAVVESMRIVESARADPASNGPVSSQTKRPAVSRPRAFVFRSARRLAGQRTKAAAPP